MTNKRAIISVFVAVTVAGTFIAMGIVNHIESNLTQLADLYISSVDLSVMEDGRYTGKFGVFPVSAEVEVTVENNRISEIKLIKHRHGQGGAAEIIPDRVVERQTLQIDSVSGATYSSKVILKAIDNALSSAGN